MDSVSKIGERIRSLREEKGFTQQGLADSLHVKRETINMWENGFRDLKTGSVVLLADFFDVSADYLLGRTDCKSPDMDMQAVCKKTGLWPDAVDKLIAIQKEDKNIIYGTDLEELLISDELPKEVFEAFSMCVNLLIIDELAPAWTSQIYYTAEESTKGKEAESETVAMAQSAVDQIDPSLWVMSHGESQVFYRYIAEKIATKITSNVINKLKNMLDSKMEEENAER